MVSSYGRIKLKKQEAMGRFSHWVGFAPLGPPRSVSSSQVVSSATENGKWSSKVAVWIFEVDGWTVFEDQTGYLDSVGAERWLAFAETDEFVFAGFNDSIHYGQFIAINHGAILRNFLDNRQDPRHNKNIGKLAIEEAQPIETWPDVAMFAEEDKLAWPADGTGLLWLFGKID